MYNLQVEGRLRNRSMANRVIPISLLPERCPFPPIDLSSWPQESFDLSDLGRHVVFYHLALPRVRRERRRPIVSANSETNVGAPTIIRGGVNGRGISPPGGGGVDATSGSAIIEEREWVTRERFANPYIVDCETSVIPPTIFCFTPRRVWSGEVRS